MDDSSSKRDRLKAVVLLLIGFIIGFAAHAFTTTQDVSPDATDTSTSTSETEMSTSSSMSGDEMTSDSDSSNTSAVDATANNAELEGFSLSVKDQSAGNIVHVSQVTLENDAWVAIREDADGGLGNILGAGWYPKGRYTVSVELLRETEVDGMYYAVIYQDNGDKEFDYTEDTLVTGDDGKVLVAKFRTY
jgi:hypothetical protein